MKPVKVLREGEFIFFALILDLILANYRLFLNQPYVL